MAAFATTWVFAFAVYLLLTAGSGAVLGLWAGGELKLGILIAFVVAAASSSIFGKEVSGRMLNPLRWLRMLGYVCGGFFMEMAKANWDVAQRVLTGRIRPGIVRVETGMRTDTGLVMLANSITLTPGTLTVEVDPVARELFVHMLQVPEGMEARTSIEARELFVGYDCPAAIRRMAE
ncbi:MAG: Na+/H+ antiporter subunit E [Verrucomicrobiota bacterium]|nr:Na+/H+ antiporter subunit E [Verrucomicrobiota bacterium]